MKSVLSSIHDLRDLHSHQSWLLPGNTLIELNFDRINEAENRYYQNRVNKVLNSCGCTSGAVFATLCGCCYLLYLFFYLPQSAMNIGSIAVLMAIFFGGGIVGKFIGLLYSHLKLKFLIYRLSKRLAQ